MPPYPAYNEAMTDREQRTHIHVMDLEQTRMWRQPIRTLRDFFQDDLVHQVRHRAEKTGFGGAVIYDYEENVLWCSEFGD